MSSSPLQADKILRGFNRVWNLNIIFWAFYKEKIMQVQVICFLGVTALLIAVFCLGWFSLPMFAGIEFVNGCFVYGMVFMFWYSCEGRKINTDKFSLKKEQFKRIMIEINLVKCELTAIEKNLIVLRRKISFANIFYLSGSRKLSLKEMFPVDKLPIFVLILLCYRIFFVNWKCLLVFSGELYGVYLLFYLGKLFFDNIWMRSINWFVECELIKMKAAAFYLMAGWGNNLQEGANQETRFRDALVDILKDVNISFYSRWLGVHKSRKDSFGRLSLGDLVIMAVFNLLFIFPAIIALGLLIKSFNPFFVLPMAESAVLPVLSFKGTRYFLSSPVKELSAREILPVPRNCRAARSNIFSHAPPRVFIVSPRLKFPLSFSRINLNLWKSDFVSMFNSFFRKVFIGILRLFLSLFILFGGVKVSRAQTFSRINPTAASFQEKKEPLASKDSLFKHIPLSIHVVMCVHEFAGHCEEIRALGGRGRVSLGLFHGKTTDVQIISMPMPIQKGKENGEIARSYLKEYEECLKQNKPEAAKEWLTKYNSFRNCKKNEQSIEDYVRWLRKTNYARAAAGFEAEYRLYNEFVLSLALDSFINPVQRQSVAFMALWVKIGLPLQILFRGKDIVEIGNNSGWSRDEMVIAAVLDLYLNRGEIQQLWKTSVDGRSFRKTEPFVEPVFGFNGSCLRLGVRAGFNNFADLWKMLDLGFGNIWQSSRDRGSSPVGRIIPLNVSMGQCEKEQVESSVLNKRGIIISNSSPADKIKGKTSSAVKLLRDETMVELSGGIVDILQLYGRVLLEFEAKLFSVSCFAFELEGLKKSYNDFFAEYIGYIRDIEYDFLTPAYLQYMKGRVYKMRGVLNDLNENLEKLSFFIMDEAPNISLWRRTNSKLYCLDGCLLMVMIQCVCLGIEIQLLPEYVLARRFQQDTDDICCCEGFHRLSEVIMGQIDIFASSPVYLNILEEGVTRKMKNSYLWLLFLYLYLLTVSPPDGLILNSCRIVFINFILIPADFFNSSPVTVKNLIENLNLEQLKQILAHPKKIESFGFTTCDGQQFFARGEGGLEGFLWSRREIEMYCGKSALDDHTNNLDFFNYVIAVFSAVYGCAKLADYVKRLRDRTELSFRRRDYRLMVFLERLVRLLRQEIVKKDKAGWMRTARIYQIFSRAYNREKSGQSFFQSLDEREFKRIKGMGNDTIYLLGIYPIGLEARKVRKGHENKRSGSIFSIRDHQAVNIQFAIADEDLKRSLNLEQSASYGEVERALILLSSNKPEEYGKLKCRASDEFRKMIVRAHSMGLKIIIDIVPNHIAKDNYICREHPDWVHDFIPEQDGWTDVRQLRLYMREVQDYLIETMNLWAREGVDGFRWDMGHFMTNAAIFRRFGRNVFGEEEFFARAKRELQKINPAAGLLIESYELDDELSRAEVDSTYNKNTKLDGRAGFYDALPENMWVWDHWEKKNPYQRKALIKEALNFIAFQRWQKGGATSLSFIATHDEADPYHLLGRFYRAAMALGYICASSFLVYNGQERGHNYDQDKTPVENPEIKALPFESDATLVWEENTVDSFHQGLFDFYRQNREIIEKGGFGVIDVPDSLVIGVKIPYKDRAVVVLVNTGSQWAKVDLNLFPGIDLGIWIDSYYFGIVENSKKTTSSPAEKRESWWQKGYSALQLPIFSYRQKKGPDLGIGKFTDGFDTYRDYHQRTGIDTMLDLPVHPCAENLIDPVCFPKMEKVIGESYSPYSSYSRRALNELNINWDIIVADSFPKEIEIPLYPQRRYKNVTDINYAAVEERENILAGRVFEEFLKGVNERKYEDIKTALEKFKNNPDFSWLEDYCSFRAFKDIYNGSHWFFWWQKQEVKGILSGKIKDEEYEKRKEYYKFAQFWAAKQFLERMDRIHHIGGHVLFDLPYFCGKDSVEGGSFRDNKGYFQDLSKSPGVWDQEWWSCARYNYTNLRKQPRPFDFILADYEYHLRVLKYDGGRVDAAHMAYPWVDKKDRMSGDEPGDELMRAIKALFDQYGAICITEQLGAPDWVADKLRNLGLITMDIMICHKDDLRLDPRCHVSISTHDGIVHGAKIADFWGEGENIAVEILERLFYSGAKFRCFVVGTEVGDHYRINNPFLSTLRLMEELNWRYRIPKQGDPDYKQRVKFDISGKIKQFIEDSVMADEDIFQKGVEEARGIVENKILSVSPEESGGLNSNINFLLRYDNGQQELKSVTAAKRDICREIFLAVSGAPKESRWALFHHSYNGDFINLAEDVLKSIQGLKKAEAESLWKYIANLKQEYHKSATVARKANINIRMLGFMTGVIGCLLGKDGSRSSSPMAYRSSNLGSSPLLNKYSLQSVWDKFINVVTEVGMYEHVQSGWFFPELVSSALLIGLHGDIPHLTFFRLPYQDFISAIENFGLPLEVSCSSPVFKAKTIQNIDNLLYLSLIPSARIKGVTFVVRVDFNDTHFDPKERIIDDIRLNAARPTFKYILYNGGKIVLIAHYGRPNGIRGTQYSIIYLLRVGIKYCVPRIKEVHIYSKEYRKLGIVTAIVKQAAKILLRKGKSFLTIEDVLNEVMEAWIEIGDKFDIDNGLNWYCTRRELKIELSEDKVNASGMEPKILSGVQKYLLRLLSETSFVQSKLKISVDLLLNRFEENQQYVISKENINDVCGINRGHKEFFEKWLLHSEEQGLEVILRGISSMNFQTIKEIEEVLEFLSYTARIYKNAVEICMLAARVYFNVRQYANRVKGIQIGNEKDISSAVRNGAFGVLSSPVVKMAKGLEVKVMENQYSNSYPVNEGESYDKHIKQIRESIQIMGDSVLPVDCCKDNSIVLSGNLFPVFWPQLSGGIVSEQDKTELIKDVWMTLRHYLNNVVSGAMEISIFYAGLKKDFKKTHSAISEHIDFINDMKRKIFWIFFQTAGIGKFEGGLKRIKDNGAAVNLAEVKVNNDDCENEFLAALSDLWESSFSSNESAASPIAGGCWSDFYNRLASASPARVAVTDIMKMIFKTRWAANDMNPINTFSGEAVEAVLYFVFFVDAGGQAANDVSEKPFEEIFREMLGDPAPIENLVPDLSGVQSLLEIIIKYGMSWASGWFGNGAKNSSSCLVKENKFAFSGGNVLFYIVLWQTIIQKGALQSLIISRWSYYSSLGRSDNPIITTITRALKDTVLNIKFNLINTSPIKIAIALPLNISINAEPNAFLRVFEKNLFIIVQNLAYILRRVKGNYSFLINQVQGQPLECEMILMFLSVSQVYILQFTFQGLTLLFHLFRLTTSPSSLEEMVDGRLQIVDSVAASPVFVSSFYNSRSDPAVFSVYHLIFSFSLLVSIPSPLSITIRRQSSSVDTTESGLLFRKKSSSNIKCFKALELKPLLDDLDILCGSQDETIKIINNLGERKGCNKVYLVINGKMFSDKPDSGKVVYEYDIDGENYKICLNLKTLAYRKEVGLELVELALTFCNGISVFIKVYNRLYELTQQETDCFVIEDIRSVLESITQATVGNVDLAIGEKYQMEFGRGYLPYELLSEQKIKVKDIIEIGAGVPPSVIGSDDFILFKEKNPNAQILFVDSLMPGFIYENVDNYKNWESHDYYLFSLDGKYMGYLKTDSSNHPKYCWFTYQGYKGEDAVKNAKKLSIRQVLREWLKSNKKEEGEELLKNCHFVRGSFATRIKEVDVIISTNALYWQEPFKVIKTNQTYAAIMLKEGGIFINCFDDVWLSIYRKENDLLVFEKVVLNKTLPHQLKKSDYPYAWHAIRWHDLVKSCDILHPKERAAVLERFEFVKKVGSSSVSIEKQGQPLKCVTLQALLPRAVIPVSGSKYISMPDAISFFVIGDGVSLITYERSDPVVACPLFCRYIGREKTGSDLEMGNDVDVFICKPCLYLSIPISKSDPRRVLQHLSSRLSLQNMGKNGDGPDLSSSPARILAEGIFSPVEGKVASLFFGEPEVDLFDLRQENSSPAFVRDFLEEALVLGWVDPETNIHYSFFFNPSYSAPWYSLGLKDSAGNKTVFDDLILFRVFEKKDIRFHWLWLKDVLFEDGEVRDLNGKDLGSYIFEILSKLAERIELEDISHAESVAMLCVLMKGFDGLMEEVKPLIIKALNNIHTLLVKQNRMGIWRKFLEKTSFPENKISRRMVIEEFSENELKIIKLILRLYYEEGAQICESDLDLVPFGFFLRRLGFYNLKLCVVSCRCNFSVNMTAEKREDTGSASPVGKHSVVYIRSAVTAAIYPSNMRNVVETGNWKALFFGNSSPAKILAVEFSVWPHAPPVFVSLFHNSRADPVIPQGCLEKRRFSSPVYDSVVLGEAYAVDLACKIIYAADGINDMEANLTLHEGEYVFGLEYFYKEGKVLLANRKLLSFERKGFFNMFQLVDEALKVCQKYDLPCFSDIEKYLKYSRKIILFDAEKESLKVIAYRVQKIVSIMLAAVMVEKYKTEGRHPFSFLKMQKDSFPLEGKEQQSSSSILEVYLRNASPVSDFQVSGFDSVNVAYLMFQNACHICGFMLCGKISSKKIQSQTLKWEMMSMFLFVSKAYIIQFPFQGLTLLFLEDGMEGRVIISSPCQKNENAGKSGASVSFVGRQRIAQIGDRAQAIGVVNRGGKKYLQVALVGEEANAYERELEPGAEGFLLGMLSQLREFVVHPLHRRIVELFSRLYEEYPAHFFVYSELFYDLFGVVVPEQNLVVLEKSLTRDLEHAPKESRNSHLVAVFRKIAAIMILRGVVHLSISEDKRTLVLVNGNSASFHIDISGWTIDRFRRKDDVWIDWSAQELNLLENQHYLLRILQAEIRPREDEGLSHRILLEQDRGVVDNVLEKMRAGENTQIRTLVTTLFERGFMTQNNAQAMTDFVERTLRGTGNFRGPEILESMLLWFSLPEVDNDNVYLVMNIFRAITRMLPRERQFDGYFYNADAAFGALIALAKNDVVRHDTVICALDLFTPPFNAGLSLAYSYDFYQAFGRPYFDAIIRWANEGVINKNNFRDACDLFLDGVNASTQTSIVENRVYVLMDLVRQADGIYERYPLERAGFFTGELEAGFLEKGWLVADPERGEYAYLVEPSFTGLDEEFCQWFAQESKYGRGNGLAEDRRRKSREAAFKLIERSLRRSLGWSQQSTINANNLTKAKTLLLIIHQQSRQSNENERVCLCAFADLLARAQTEGVLLNIDLLTVLASLGGGRVSERFGFLESFIDKTKNLPLARQTFFSTDVLLRMVSAGSNNLQINELLKEIDDILILTNKYSFEEYIITEDFLEILVLRGCNDLRSSLLQIKNVLWLFDTNNPPPDDLVRFAVSPGVLKAIILAEGKKSSHIIWGMISVLEKKESARADLLRYLYEQGVYLSGEDISADVVPERLLALAPEPAPLASLTAVIYAAYDRPEYKIPREKSCGFVGELVPIDHSKARVEIGISLGVEKISLFLDAKNSIMDKKDWVKAAVFQKYHGFIDALFTALPKTAALYEFYHWVPYVFNVILPSCEGVSDGGVSIFHDFIDQPVAVFNGVIKYLFQQGVADISVDGANWILVVRLWDETYKISLSEWTLSSLDREGQGWSRRFVSAAAEDVGYFLRLLQREVLGPYDVDFFRCLNEQRMRLGVVEEILGEEEPEWKKDIFDRELSEMEKLNRNIKQRTRKTLSMLAERGLILREDKEKVRNFFSAVDPSYSDSHPMHVYDTLEGLMSDHCLTRKNIDAAFDLIHVVASGRSFDGTKYEGYGRGGVENRNLALGILNGLREDKVLSSENIEDAAVLLRSDFIKKDSGWSSGGEVMKVYLEAIQEVLNAKLVSKSTWSEFVSLFVDVIAEEVPFVSDMVSKALSFKEAVLKGEINLANFRCVVQALLLKPLFQELGIDNPVVFLVGHPVLVEALADGTINQENQHDFVKRVRILVKMFPVSWIIPKDGRSLLAIFDDKEKLQTIIFNPRLIKLSHRVQQEIDAYDTDELRRMFWESLGYLACRFETVEEILREVDFLRRLLDIIHTNAPAVLVSLKNIGLKTEDIDDIRRVIPFNNPLTRVLVALGGIQPWGFGDLIKGIKNAGRFDNLKKILLSIARRGQRIAPQNIYG
ncbi:MAG: 4-alpha-glucanotransferase, partial [bacterium]